MRELSLLGVLVVAILSGVSQAVINVATKKATAYCMKDVQANTLAMHFTLMLGTDPVGSVLDLQPPTVMPRGNIWAENTVGVCDAPYNNGGSYNVDSTVDLSATANHVNACGFQEVLGTYTWYILHRVLTDGFENGFVDYDRIYKIECDTNNIMDNLIAATIGVTTPNLEQTLDISNITVNMYVERYDEPNTVWSVATEAAVGETLRLTLEMDIASPYRSRLDPYGIYGYSTIIGSSSAISENDLLIDSKGCANNLAASRPPFSTTIGWRWLSANNPSNSGKWKLTSGDFPAYKYGVSTQMHFLTYWKPCFDPRPTTDTCTNPCLALFGLNEPARKKRQAEDESRTIVTEIHIVDHRHSNNEGGTSTLVIVVCALLGLLGVIMVASLVFAFSRRQRRHRDAGTRADSRPPHYFENPPPVYSEKDGVKY